MDGDLTYLMPLLDEASGLGSADPSGRLTFGLATPLEHSQLYDDDLDMSGFPVSHVVMNSIDSAIDHALTLRALFARDTPVITNAAMWTLMRGVLDGSAAAVWVLDPDKRAVRRERALRIWRHDYVEHRNWLRDAEPPANDVLVSPAKRLADLDAVVSRHSLEPKQVACDFNYGDTVQHAARAIGADPKEAVAIWREASGFAHGRFWPFLRRSTMEGARRIPGGLEMTVTLDEARHERLVNLSYQLFRRAIDIYSKRSEPPA